MASVSRIVAAVTLAALLACSSLGVCWRVFAADAHDCCRRGDGIAAAARNGCSSDVTALAPTMLAPPTAAIGPYPAPPVPVSSDHDVLALVLPAKPPPLVLRI